MPPTIQAPPDRLRYLRDLQRRSASAQATASQRYYNDPVAFAADCIDWGDGAGLTAYQQAIVGDLPARKRISVRSPHGTGKSTLSAVTILWFALTREAAGVDWKVATTAGSWHQLSRFLWPEIHKWAQSIRWDKVRAGRGLTAHEELNVRLRGHPFGPSELMNLNLRLNHGSAFASASANAALIEGAHADSLLFVFDEAKAIPAGTFDACEGALNGTGEAFALCLSTPGSPQGRFYDIQSRKPGYEDWHAVHVTLDQAIAAGQISREWAAQRALQWGEQSSIYQNRVLGEFHAGDEDSVIPLAWAEAAVERWHEWDLAGRPGTDMDYPRTAGVDVARFGTAKTVIAIRNGPVLVELRKTAKEDTMQTAGRVKAVLDADAARTGIIDVIGVGGGVFDRLREQDCKVQAFNASGGTDRRDKTNEFSFNNCRSAAWWGLREQLDPSADSDLCLPDDDMLLGDLSAPTWKITSGGKIAVESKDEIEKRLGRSTDDGDAAVEAYWPRSLPHSPSARQWAAHGDLERLAEDRTRRRPGERRDDWNEPDAWAPRDDDGRPDRPNVRTWRLRLVSGLSREHGPDPRERGRLRPQRRVLGPECLHLGYQRRESALHGGQVHRRGRVHRGGLGRGIGAVRGVPVRRRHGTRLRPGRRERHEDWRRRGSLGAGVEELFHLPGVQLLPALRLGPDAVLIGQVLASLRLARERCPALRAVPQLDPVRRVGGALLLVRVQARLAAVGGVAAGGVPVAALQDGRGLLRGRHR